MVIPTLLALALTPDGCHKVQTDMILARDVAEVIPAFAQIPGDFSVGFVPTSGEPRIVRGVDLQRIAKNRRLDLDGLPDVCFARDTFVPQAAQVRAAMLAELKDLAGANIEVLSWGQQPAPAGELVFSRDGMQLPQGSGAHPEVFWHGYVRYGDSTDARRFPIWAKVRITAHVTRVVASAPIPVGKPIQAGQVRLETTEDFPFDETVARNLDEVVGYLPKSSLRAGSVIHRTQIEPAPDV